MPVMCIWLKQGHFCRALVYLTALGHMRKFKLARSLQAHGKLKGLSVSSRGAESQIVQEV